MSELLAYVYRWTHIPTGKWYIGSRTARGCHPDDGYICSSKHVKPLIENDMSNWEREIMTYGSPYWMRIVEKELLKVSDAMNNPMSLNRSNGYCPEITSTQGKKRMNKNGTNITVLESDVDLYIENGWKLGFSEKVKENMKDNHADVSGEKNPMYGVKRIGQAATFYGKKHSSETIEKMKKPKTRQHKLAISKSKKGDKNGMFGKKQPKKYCSHCGQHIAVNIYARWHGENCKKEVNT